MADVTVLDFPTATVPAATDWLYLLQGSGSSRDKKMSLTSLFGAIPCPVVINTPADENGLIVNIGGLPALQVMDVDGTPNHPLVDVPLCLDDAHYFGIGDVGVYGDHGNGGLWVLDDLTVNGRGVFRRSVAGNATNLAGAVINTLATSTPVGGFGSCLDFGFADLALAYHLQGRVGFHRDGSDDSAYFEVMTRVAGSSYIPIKAFGTVAWFAGLSGNVRRPATSDTEIAITDVHIMLSASANGVLASTTTFEDGQIIYVHAPDSVQGNITGGSLYGNGYYTGGGTPSIVIPKNTMCTLVWDATLRLFRTSIAFT